ncbi:MAG: lysophospholipid acyltransferase family protein [Gammaproteobacteria bacterium]|nr:lysophospholipid acyltransferase family protein [Gammaproteobacteria bacterium]
MQPSPTALLKQFPGARFWPVWLMAGLLKLLSWLPLPAIYGLGRIAGDIAYCLHHPRRKIVWRNLSACFPNKNKAQIRALARGHFRILMIAVLASGVSWWGGKTRLRRLVRFRNREIYDQARARGENIILLAPHFVGLEHGGICLSMMAPTVSMYRPNKNPLMDALIKRYRSRFGGVQYVRGSVPGALIKSIRGGCQFYYLPDQDPGRNKGVFAPFYSLPAATFATLGRIARMSDAQVIPCMTRILPRGLGFEIIFEQPLADYPSGDRVLDATTMNRAIETLIEYAPAQYFWSHRRFKTRAEGEPPFYR